MRNHILKIKRESGMLKFSDIFSSSSVSQIYLSEMVPSALHKLRLLAKTKADELNYKYVWIREGKLFVRKNDESDKIQIISESDLNKMIWLSNSPSQNERPDIRVRPYIRVAQINANSVQGHLLEIEAFLTENSIDILSISESWLTPNHSDSAFSIPNYSLIRIDRGKREYVQAGGVACYIRNGLSYKISVRLSIF